ncbi:hypothetical protein YYG_01113 [Plasmodium vinckei petteri]|uniref:Uncharacterized protein n=1 Tax=Plasmodium vinckei petteri TaxID=138298 RepID=W7AZH3_PLAVN|nr:hypothetical protein YYG_01113 [Plasmodium vinckei petteri]CAD2105869.1 conserved Plasmodium protein, unknown function [Plasmodium vinckei petteri]
MCDIENIDNNKNDDCNLGDIKNDNYIEEHIDNCNGSTKDEMSIHENDHSYANVLYFKKLKLNKRIFGKLKDKNIVIYLKYKDSKCTSKNIQVTHPEINNLYLCFLITEPFIKDEKNIIKIYIKYFKDDKYKILSFGFLELNLIDFSEQFYKKKSYMLCYDKNNNKYIFGYFILILANQIKWTVHNNNVSYEITKNSYFINNQINYDEQLLYICKKIEKILLKSVSTNKSNSIQNNQNKDLLKHFSVTHSCPATFRIPSKEKKALNDTITKQDENQKDDKEIADQSTEIDNVDEKCENITIKTNDNHSDNHIKQVEQDINLYENNDETSSTNQNIKKHKSLQNFNNQNPRLKIPPNYLNSKKTNFDDNSICNYHSDGAIKKSFSETSLSRLILDEDQSIEKFSLLKKKMTIKPKPKLKLKPLDSKINNFIIKNKNNISTNKTKSFLEKHHKMYHARNNKIPIKHTTSPTNIIQNEETKEDYPISCMDNIFDGDGDKDLSDHSSNVPTCIENKMSIATTQSLDELKNNDDILTEVHKPLDEPDILHNKNESNKICNYNDPDVDYIDNSEKEEKVDKADSIYTDENLFDIFILKKLENILNNDLDNFIEQAEFILHHMKKKMLKKNEFFTEQIKTQYNTNTVLIKKETSDQPNLTNDGNGGCYMVDKQAEDTEKNNINYNVKSDILKILENCINTTLLYIQFVLNDKNVDTTQKDIFITYREIINNIKNAIDDCKKQKEALLLNSTNNANFDNLSKDRKNTLLSATKPENESVMKKRDSYSYFNDDPYLTMSSCSDSSQTEEIMIFKPVNYINKNISTSIQYYQKKWKHKLSKVGMYV